MRKISKRALGLNLETVRMLAGPELDRVFAGLPIGSGDDCPPTTFTAPTCDGQSCAATQCNNCYSEGKKACR